MKNKAQSSVKVFKGKLDNWLHSVPDEPQTSGIERTRAESNSIPHLFQFLLAERWLT